MTPSVGPGKYDPICTTAREVARAEAAVVIIINGVAGSGFSIQIEQRSIRVVTAILPQVLREVADSIEESAARGREQR